MRENKFRAWDKENKIMFRDNLTVLATLRSKFLCEENGDLDVYRHFEFMQYTGLKVKTGEVFEGDIGKSVDGIFLVTWDEEKAAFVMRFYGYPEETLYLEEMWNDAEVIGNIYENPELLEGIKWKA